MPLCKAQQSSANVFENSNCLVSGSSSNSSPDVGLGLSLRYFIYSLTGFWVGGIYYGWCVPDGSLWWWASGGIETASLQEKWSYEGDFVGDIYWDGGPGGGFFIGASGFSGMYYADHYFGYARQVKITTEKWIS